MLRHRGICIHPGANLVTNVGFGAAATHTHNAYAFYNNLKSYSGVNLSDLRAVEVDRKYNEFLQNEFFLDRVTIRNLPYRVLTKASLVGHRVLANIEALWRRGCRTN